MVRVLAALCLLVLACDDAPPARSPRGGCQDVAFSVVDDPTSMDSVKVRGGVKASDEHLCPK